MKVSTKGRYGLRLMLDLALNVEGNEKVALKQVAQRQGISEKYLWNIASRLKGAGLINAVPGLNGGYTLSRAPEDISLAEILDALEGGLFLVPCVGKSSCARNDSCAVQSVWVDLNSKVNSYMESVKLSDIMDKHAEMAVKEPVVYNI